MGEPMMPVKLTFFCKTAVRGLFSIGLAVSILECGLDASPARAIDCAKAKSKIELAICSDETLKKKDAELAERFFRLLRSSSDVPTASQRERLLADQREWIASREEQCDAVDQTQIRQCISSSIGQRNEDLEFASEERAKDAGLMKQMEFSVGRAALKVASTGPAACGRYALAYDNKLIACGSPDLYSGPAFVVKARLKRGADEAVLLESHDGGQMNCAHYYVLVFEEPRGFRTDEFGESCLVPGRGGDASRIGQGFQFLRPAEPASAGEQLNWTWQTGIARTAIAYVPNGSVRMNDLMTAKEKELTEPLRNEEFYRAVSTIPESDRNDFLVSLQYVEKPCDCRAIIDMKRYGLRRTNGLYSISACGLYLGSYLVRCSGPHVLAVWEKSSGQFYFAIVHKDAPRDHAYDDIHAFPPFDNWSDAARGQYNDWRNNAPCPLRQDVAAAA
jgi:uncharacterized protein YecT (DUF1311 family)